MILDFQNDELCGLSSEEHGLIQLNAENNSGRILQGLKRNQSARSTSGKK